MAYDSEDEENGGGSSLNKKASSDLPSWILDFEKTSKEKEKGV